MRYFGLMLALVLPAGCKTTSSISGTQSFVQPSSAWPSTIIAVCWESSADGFEAEKQWVEDAVKTAFQATPLDWVGWDDCTADDTLSVRIGVKDERTYTVALGRYLAGVKNGMVLNLEFKSYAHDYCKNRLKDCVTFSAVHEFGHAAGLEHEQDRADTPEPCRAKADKTIEPDAANIGEYDPSSVMNYCNPVWNNDGKLSEGDLEGLNSLYNH